jgi:hypothetical protein
MLPKFKSQNPNPKLLSAKFQIPNSTLCAKSQIPNPKSQIFFLSAKSQIQVPNPKSQIILDLGSIYNLAKIKELI